MRNGSRGVTLIELCVGLAVVAMLAGLAVPQFRPALRAAAVRTAVYELLAGVQQARAASILEGRTAVLCPSDADGQCLPGAKAGHWSVSLETDGGATALAGLALPPGVILHSSRPRLSFWPDSLAASTGTLTICDTQRIARPRSIVVSQGGRARVADAADAACP